MIDELAAWQALLSALGGAAFAWAALRTARSHPDIGHPPAPPAEEAAASIAIEALEEPLLLIDAGFRIVAANIPARALLGFDIVGEDVRVALRQPPVLEALRDARAGTRVDREVGAVGRGEGFYRLRAGLLPDGRLLATFVDISRVRLAERARADFVANASHELRTPLATIRGFVETLQGPAADDAPARTRFLDIMRREADRMTRLIDDLLSLSRIELDKFVRPQVALDVAPLLADVARTLGQRLEADRRALIVDSTDPPPIIGDRDQVLQVLHNLLSNAIKYGRSGTPVRLRTQIDGEALRITVADEGDGIAPEDLPRLTERFYRVDTGRSRSLGGTGLGLAIVKHIIERHRGRLAIESTSGEGTTVWFTLPSSRQPETRTRVRQGILEMLGRPTGIEPATSGTTNRAI